MNEDLGQKNYQDSTIYDKEKLRLSYTEAELYILRLSVSY